MSAICGIIHLDNTPCQAFEIKAMLNATKEWGVNGEKYKIDNNIGLGCQILWNTPESPYDERFICENIDNYILTCSARLDNRAELLNLFEISKKESETTPDSELVLMAYRKWGEDCPVHLIGDWAFAIWDQQNKKLFIARDHAGNTSLFYYQSSTFFVFASSLKALFAIQKVPRALNEYALSKHLILFPPTPQTTFYKNVNRLAAAHSLVIENNKVKLNQYWDLRNEPKVRYANDTDYVDHFKEILQESVRCRLRTSEPIGATLSGGLDSSTISATAAKILKSTGKRLTTITSIPQHDVSWFSESRRFADESEFARATAQYSGNIDSHFIPAQNISPLEGVRRTFEILDEPLRVGANAYWIHAIFHKFKQQNLGTMLTGQCGNESISWHGGGYLVSLFKKGRWLLLSKEFSALKKIKPTLYKNISFRKEIIESVLPDFCQKYRRKYRKQNQKSIQRSYLNPHIAEKLNLAEKIESDPDIVFNVLNTSSGKQRLTFIKNGSATSSQFWHLIGGHNGIEVRDPTRDIRLMAFCLGIPDRLYLQNGIDRHLIRVAMKGILPDAVRLNMTRGRQSVDVFLRMRDGLEEYETTLAVLKTSPFVKEYLNTTKMEDNLKIIKTSDDFPRNTILARHFLNAVMTGFFLQSFD